MLEVARRLGSYGDVEALVTDDERLTYQELDERVTQVVRRLSGLGVRRGGRVGLLMPNTASMICHLLAAWDIGAVVVPLNTRYRSHELQYVVGHSDIEVLVTGQFGGGFPDLGERLLAAFPALRTQADPLALSVPDAPALRSIVMLGAAPVEPAFVTAEQCDALAADLPADRAADDELLLIYTSGTTAHPKGVVHSLGAFVQTARHTAASMGVQVGDVVWDPLPLFHTGGLLPLLGTLDLGATFVTSAHFDPGTGLELLARERVTAAYVAFSTLVTSLLDHPDFATTDVSALRWILAIGPEGLLDRVQRSLPGAVQVSCYGCTEAGGVVVYNDVTDPAAARATTAGNPFPGVQIRIVDPVQGRQVNAGGTGEIQVRSDAVLRRYHREPASPVDGEGWFATGDLGRFDDDGRLVFLGRLKDMFKIGGENVAASEIEFVLAAHQAVTFAQVVSVPDERLSEVAAAFVELKPGAAVTADELREFCAQRLASFKVPRHVRMVEEWPMSATKVQKFKLRDQLLDELAVGA
ncbi:MAG: AMP-binding protein [Streptosporangiales bacterium]|nr:AMP-binding protein [Streptosporangiales bacterium]